MRIFVTGDLHWGARETGDAGTRRLAKWIRETANPTDVLLIVGDFANEDDGVAACLQQFAGFPGARAAVIGNHDTWVMAGDERDSWMRRDAVHQRLRSYGFHVLEDGPLVVEDVAFVGCMGWYDYSFADLPGVDTTWYATKTMPGTDQVCWNDAVFTRFGQDDRQVTAWQLAILRDQLSAVPRNHKVVVATHHLPHKRLLVHPRLLVPKPWRFANTFLGSHAFADLLEQSGHRQMRVFSGHLHTRRSVKRRGITYSVVGSDHLHKRVIVYDPARESSPWVSA